MYHLQANIFCAIQHPYKNGTYHLQANILCPIHPYKNAMYHGDKMSSNMPCIYGGNDVFMSIKADSGTFCLNIFNC